MSETKSNLTERDLVIRFRDACETKAKHKTALSFAQAEYDEVETLLLECLEAQDKTRSAAYEGIGHCTAVKPRLFASCNKDNEDDLFKFLRTEGRDDLIKEKVNSKSLSSYVAERIDEGKSIPEFVTYALMHSAKFYPEKK